MTSRTRLVASRWGCHGWQANASFGRRRVFSVPVWWKIDVIFGGDQYGCDEACHAGDA